MKIENQICNEAQSWTLQDLGIKYKDYQFAFVDFGTSSGQETVLCRPATETEEFHKQWAWVLIGNHSKEIREEIEEGTLGADGGVYPAFTVAELGCWLPSHFRIHKYANDSWQFTVADSDWKNWKMYKTEAESRAAMLIYFLENNLITAEEVNKRLNNGKA